MEVEKTFYYADGDKYWNIEIIKGNMRTTSKIYVEKNDSPNLCSTELDQTNNFFYTADNTYLYVTEGL